MTSNSIGKQTIMTSYAVFADCHGNSWALRAVLDDIERRDVSKIINLGDSADHHLDPGGVISLLMESGVESIAGNYETHTTGQLTTQQITWLESLPKTLEIDELFCCHGTPVSDHDELLEDVTMPHVGIASAETIQKRLGEIENPVILCAHKHVPRLVQLPTGQLIVNPGSVGWPAYWNDEPALHIMEAGSPHARYAILTETDAGWMVDHIAVPYNHEAAANIAQKSGCEERAEAIRTGRMTIPAEEL